MNLIGRKEEIKELEKLYESGKSELIALTGRRRVGKTYLVDQLFEDRITFYHVGVSPKELKDSSNRKMKAQLDAFYASLITAGAKTKKPSNWFEAFTSLINYLKEKDNGERLLIFIDELPWMDTPKSDFLPALEWFWNLYGANQSNIMMILCGSSTSWMLNKVINSHGGLYDRITDSIHLSPFTLKECELFYKQKGYDLSRYTIALIYMVFGGIPYYMNYYQKKLSIDQNIDNLFFANNAKLRNEYDNLFESSFDKDKLAKKIVELLITKNKGFTRKEFLEKLKLSDGDDIGKTIKALINSDFIIEYVPFKGNKKQKYYKVIDPFCLFYLKQVKDNISLDKSLFENKNNTNWIGIAFENLCASHLEAIINALKIQRIRTIQFSLFINPDEKSRGSQIDLLIERKDRTINLCEMKFYNDEFKVDKSYHLNLMEKKNNVKKISSTRFDVDLVLITTFGLNKTGYFDDFNFVITLDDLFENN